MNLLTKQKATYKLREPPFVQGWGREGGGIVREFGMDMCILLYVKCIANKNLWMNNQPRPICLWRVVTTDFNEACR